jgi:hypothetical protein
MDAVCRNFVAECFWPGVHEQDVRDLDKRIRACTAAAKDVRYLGSFLIRADEVVICQFEGTQDTVRTLAEQAGVPFERLLETAVASTAATPEKGESDV